jgi:hypothetical protein
MMSRISPRIITMTSTTADNMAAIYPAGEAYASCAPQACTSALCRGKVPGVAASGAQWVGFVGGRQQSAGLWGLDRHLGRDADRDRAGIDLDPQFRGGGAGTAVKFVREGPVEPDPELFTLGDLNETVIPRPGPA